MKQQYYLINKTIAETLNGSILLNAYVTHSGI